MKFQTKYHGVLEYKEEDVICFKKGLPGFEQIKKFIMVPVEDNPIFSILHSLEDESLGFILVSPFQAEKEYEFELKEEIQKELNINNPKEVLVLNTVTLNSDIRNITVNLRAPIIINIKDKLGEQIILENEKYKVKHPLIKE